MQIRNNILPVLNALDEHDINELRKTILSGWWGRGPKVEELEKKLQKKLAQNMLLLLLVILLELILF